MAIRISQRTRRGLLSVLGAVLLAAPAAHAEATTGPLVTVSPAQFLGMPEPLQAAYVAGVIDGMTYTTWGYRIDDHDAFVACVRTIPVDEFTQRVIKWLALNGSRVEVTVTAVARVAGAQCRKPEPEAEP